MAEQDLDRGHSATPYKLAEARKKGSVAKSPDVTNVALLGVAVLWCYVLARPMLTHWVDVQHRWWNWSSLAGLDMQRAMALVSDLCMAAGFLLAPLFLTLMVVAVLAQWGQTGPVWSTHPLIADFKRLNPGEGLKRLFTLKTIYLAAKSSIKLAVLAGVFWWSFEALFGVFMGLSWLPPKVQVMRLPDLLGGMLTKLWLALLVLALIDLIYTRWEFARQMRMSARDLKDEAKHREGDPRVRRRLRELRIERLRQSQAVGQVPSADVLITNPTRLAVAVRYDRNTQAAPSLVAKGAGGLAKQMREMAYRHGIPVVQNPPLARALYRHSQIGGTAPEAWYPVLAKILVWVYAAREQKVKAKGAA